MTRTEQEKSEIAGKVKDIRLKHLLTWTAQEWEKEYGYLKDEVLIWDKIKEDCEHHWPWVDLEKLLNSYALFGPEYAEENGLHNILQCGDRNKTGAKLAENRGDNDSLIALMRYLLGIGGMEGIDKKLSSGKWKHALAAMKESDPAVTLLQFASAESSSPKYMLKYGTSPSDESGDFLTIETITHLDDILGKLRGDDQLSRFTPMRDMRYTDLTAIMRDGIVRMDVINYVAGCLKDIRIAASSVAANVANTKTYGDSCDLRLPAFSWWKDTNCDDWEIRNMGGSLLMTHYKKDKTYKRFCCIVVNDDDGSLTAYIEKPELAQRLFDRENPADMVAYAILNIRDKKGRDRIDVRDNDIQTAHMRFTIQTTDKTMRSFLGTEELTLQDRDLSDMYKECKPMGCCDLPAEQQEATCSSSFIYLPYETERSQTESGIGLCATKSWLRIPRGQKYEMLHEGEQCDLLNITTSELPVLRTVRGKDGSIRDILLFSLKNIIVDVTEALHPKVGGVMPYGIMLVESPTATYTSTTWRLASISDARIEGRDETGRMVAKVTYAITSCKRDGAGTETDNVTVREYVREPRP